MFFEALYFGHLLSFYTMQLEPPKTLSMIFSLGENQQGAFKTNARNKHKCEQMRNLFST